MTGEYTGTNGKVGPDQRDLYISWTHRIYIQACYTEHLILDKDEMMKQNHKQEEQTWCCSYSCATETEPKLAGSYNYLYHLSMKSH